MFVFPGLQVIRFCHCSLTCFGAKAPVYISNSYFSWRHTYFLFKFEAVKPVFISARLLSGSKHLWRLTKLFFPFARIRRIIIFFLTSCYVYLSFTSETVSNNIRYRILPQDVYSSNTKLQFFFFCYLLSSFCE